MRIPITVTIAFGYTVSIAHRDAIANAIGDAIGKPVGVTFATAIGYTTSEAERIPDADFDPDRAPYDQHATTVHEPWMDSDVDTEWHNERRRHPTR